MPKLSFQPDRVLTLTLNYLRNGVSIGTIEDPLSPLMTVVFRFLFRRVLCNCEQIDCAKNMTRPLFLEFPYNSGKKTVRIARYPVMASD